MSTSAEVWIWPTFRDRVAPGLSTRCGEPIWPGLVKPADRGIDS